MTGGSNPFSGWISGSPRLLARLDLEALLGGVGSYTLGVVGLNSSFTDDTFTPFTFNSPSININVTAVPEPSSIGGAAALALGGLHFRRRRSKLVQR